MEYGTYQAPYLDGRKQPEACSRRACAAHREDLGSKTGDSGSRGVNLCKLTDSVRAGGVVVALEKEVVVSGSKGKQYKYFVLKIRTYG